jgi:hypothetical protein
VVRKRWLERRGASVGGGEKESERKKEREKERANRLYVRGWDGGRGKQSDGGETPKRESGERKEGSSHMSE